jgi:hypothetical protein
MKHPYTTNTERLANGILKDGAALMVIFGIILAIALWADIAEHIQRGI